MVDTSEKFQSLLRTIVVWGAVLLALIPKAGWAEELVLQLGHNWTAEISTNEAERTLTLSLYQGTSMVQSLALGNASFNSEDVKAVVLCRDCAPSYFIPAWDRSSTYGAVTGLILSGDIGWSVTTLPFSVAGIEGPDEFGVTWLTDRNPNLPLIERFQFREGMLLSEAELELSQLGFDPALSAVLASGLAGFHPLVATAGLFGAVPSAFPLPVGEYVVRVEGSDNETIITLAREGHRYVAKSDDLEVALDFFGPVSGLYVVQAEVSRGYSVYSVYSILRIDGGEIALAYDLSVLFGEFLFDRLDIPLPVEPEEPEAEPPARSSLFWTFWSALSSSMDSFMQPERRAWSVGILTDNAHLNWALIQEFVVRYRRQLRFDAVVEPR